LRLRLKPESPAAPDIDGAWWPWSLQLPAELPALLPTLAQRLGAIAMVVFNAAVWDDAPPSLTIDGDEVRLEGLDSHEANTLAVVGTDGESLTLVVVPPDAEAPAAMKSLITASQPGHSDIGTDAATRALDEVAGKLARREGANDLERTAQIRSWVHDTAEQFAGAPIQAYVPILVERIVRGRIHGTSANE
jgi:hypothetical protein